MKKSIVLFVLIVAAVMTSACEKTQEVAVLGYGPDITLDENKDFVVDTKNIMIMTNIDGDDYAFTVDAAYADELGVIKDGEVFGTEITWNEDTGKLVMLKEPEEDIYIKVRYLEDIGVWVLD